MLDRTGRNIDYIRISITDRCNLRCVYCMPEGKITSVSNTDILSYEEIERICHVMAKMGLKKIKITGGEPLVRKNCHLLIKKLKKISGIEQVTLTTNGILLKNQIELLSQSGIDGINISLDTLNKEKYREITRGGNLDDVIEGIEEVLKFPEIPLKINCVPVYSDEENIITLAELAKKFSLHVRFIEMMPIGYGKKFEFCSEDKIREIIEEKYGKMKPVSDILGNGPGAYYTVEGFKGKIGFISSISHKFCDKCNRIRLTSEGFLKTCLQYDIGCDLRESLRNGSSDIDIGNKIQQAIYDKPIGHHFGEKVEDSKEERKGMSQIGG